MGHNINRWFGNYHILDPGEHGTLGRASNDITQTEFDRLEHALNELRLGHGLLINNNGHPQLQAEFMRYVVDGANNSVAFRGLLCAIAEAPPTIGAIEINLVSQEHNDNANTIGDRWSTGRVDLSDLRMFPAVPDATNPNRLTRPEIIVHFLAERLDMRARQDFTQDGFERWSHPAGVAWENEYRLERGQVPLLPDGGYFDTHPGVDPHIIAFHLADGSIESHALVNHGDFGYAILPTSADHVFRELHPAANPDLSRRQPEEYSEWGALTPPNQTAEQPIPRHLPGSGTAESPTHPQSGHVTHGPHRKLDADSEAAAGPTAVPYTEEAKDGDLHSQIDVADPILRGGHSSIGSPIATNRENFIDPSGMPAGYAVDGAPKMRRSDMVVDPRQDRGDSGDPSALSANTGGIPDNSADQFVQTAAESAVPTGREAVSTADRETAANEGNRYMSADELDAHYGQEGSANGTGTLPGESSSQPTNSGEDIHAHDSPTGVNGDGADGSQVTAGTLPSDGDAKPSTHDQEMPVAPSSPGFSLDSVDRGNSELHVIGALPSDAQNDADGQDGAVESQGPSQPASSVITTTQTPTDGVTETVGKLPSQLDTTQQPAEEHQAPPAQIPDVDNTDGD